MRPGRAPLLLSSLLIAAVLPILWTSVDSGQDRQRVSLLLTGGTVVTVDDQRRIVSPGAVAIDGASIVAVDRADLVAARFEGAETIDTTGQVVLPGLVNTHTHAPMVLYRGLADDLALMDWLQKYIFPAEAKTVSPDFVRAGTRLATLEMIESGTTTYADMYYFEEVVAEETRRAGIRGVLGQTIIRFPVADAKTASDGLTRAEAFVKAWAKDELVIPAVAPHALYTNDLQTLRASRELADRYGVPVLIHLAETRDEVDAARKEHGQSPVAYLDSIGFWAPRTLAAHAVWVTDDDIAILARRRVSVAHNPESNMKLASGTAPVEKLRAAGVATGLGTDGAASNNDLDMFEAMRQAAFLHKLQSGDPRVVSAATALDLATREGARALGMDRLIGSLEPGKRADVILVGTDAARQVPMYDAVSHLVYVMRGDDVRTTIVNGRVLMRDRRVLTLDARQIVAEARAWAGKVKAAVGR